MKSKSSILTEVTKFRRDLHKIPELGFFVYRTAARRTISSSARSRRSSTNGEGAKNVFLKCSPTALREWWRPNVEGVTRVRRGLWKMRGSRNGWLLLPLLLMALPGCGGAASNAEKTGEVMQVTESTRISDVIDASKIGRASCRERV